jgi:uracil-DNA glycosylase
MGDDMATTVEQIALAEHIDNLRQCKLCPLMIGPVVTHTPVLSKVYLIGQAPGPREGAFGRPFAWTAGKTLFRWLETIGLNEQQFRSLAYMSAVCRCFPGKAAGGGDRVPNPAEIKACSSWMAREFELLQPELIIPVGSLAISQVFGKVALDQTIGRTFRREYFGRERDIVPLPHPSGASTWFKREPGKTLLLEALQQLAAHREWQELCKKAT